MASLDARCAISRISITTLTFLPSPKLSADLLLSNCPDTSSPVRFCTIVAAEMAQPAGGKTAWKGNHPVGQIMAARPFYRFCATGLGAAMWFFVRITTI